MKKKWFSWRALRRLDGWRRSAKNETPNAAKKTTKPPSGRFPWLPSFSLEKTSSPPRAAPVSHHPDLHEDANPAPSAPVVFPAASAFSPAALAAYLENKGNPPGEIAKLHRVLQRRSVILEIGCGRAEIGREIAGKNPDIGVIATDIYRFPRPGESTLGYGDVALAWRDRRLEAQTAPRDNLVILRSELDILRLLPYRSVDTLLFVNPEPKMGKIFLDFVGKDRLFETLKPGGRQIVIKPFCREMGVTACGGFEFDHSPDYSRGIGFLMESPFDFRIGRKIQWSVDLCAASAYSKNSTRSSVSICGGMNGGRRI
ncbi:MAG: hypothetical protein GY859_20520 [Desulfobacterales bacterium]|nr:hypothetical protein [Desulfobacterales bacterium]